MGRDASEYGTKASEDTGILSGCQVERIHWNKKEHTDPITIDRSRRKGDSKGSWKLNRGNQGNTVSWNP